MRNLPLRSLSGLALAVHFLVTPAIAAKDKEHKLSDWKIGKVLFGEKVTKGDMKGKVVVIENWGVNCPPCVASLPHLADLDRKYRDKGLVLIGAECQGSSKDEIKPLIEKAKVEYTIVDEATGPIEVTAIPRIFVFDRDGKLVFDGSPSGAPFEEAVNKAIGASEAAPAAAAESPATTSAEPLVATRSWTNAEGRAIRAAVKSVDDTSVTFIVDGGKEVKYPLDKLSAESRQLITDAAK
jgi:thiol-disulfide isomerase/thioredoxin